MKSITSRIVLVLVLLMGFIGAIIWLSNSRDRAIQQRNIALSNVKAYELRLSNQANKSRELQLTIDQLRYSQDSIIRQLLNTKNRLGIKDRELRQLAYMTSQLSYSDTIYMRDTLFIQDMRLDTTLGDQWMSNRIVLLYPNILTINSKARSEKHVIIYTSRETINPPKKFFLCRWFQKKHTVIKVEVQEKNPYIESIDNVFISTIR